MYYNLKKEMKLKKVNQHDIAELLNISQTQVSQKITNKYDFKLGEAFLIYNLLDTDKDFIELFQKIN